MDNGTLAVTYFDTIEKVFDLVDVSENHMIFTQCLDGMKDKE